MNASDLVIQLHDLARSTEDNRIRKIADDLAEVAKDHSDKGYEESTLEKVQEFAKKRNYHYTNTDNPIDFPRCTCHTCHPISALDTSSMFMRLCPDCGNKRCPKATHHDNACTNSNEPNQEGSCY